MINEKRYKKKPLETVPYTYLLRHKPSNKIYYGVKYGKDAHPDLFWKTYFTSSKLIEEIRIEDGDDSFDFQIRKIFDCPEKAVNWEKTVLRRMKVILDERWFNMSAGSFRVNSKIAARISKARTGMKFTDEHKKNLSKANRGILPVKSGQNYYVNEIVFYDGRKIIVDNLSLWAKENSISYGKLKRIRSRFYSDRYMNKQEIKEINIIGGTKNAMG